MCQEMHYERSFAPHNGGPHVITGENPFVVRRVVSMGFVVALRQRTGQLHVACNPS